AAGRPGEARPAVHPGRPGPPGVGRAARVRLDGDQRLRRRLPSGTRLIAKANRSRTVGYHAPVSVDVGPRSLVNSAVDLGDTADRLTGRPSHLLRFYAVECGLKAMILKRRNLRSTSQLDQHLRGHDLRRLAAELRLDAATYRDLRRCRRRAQGGRNDRLVE